MSDNDTAGKAPEYVFGGVKEYSLEMIEEEVLNESLYLDVFAGSDIRFKQNIKKIDTPLEKILKLNGVSWKWRQDEFPERKFNNKVEVGLIAQDVAQVLPEIVAKDSEGYLAINYSKMAPVLTEAIKELFELNKKQQDEIESLKGLLKERVLNNN